MNYTKQEIKVEGEADGPTSKEKTTVKEVRDINMNKFHNSNMSEYDEGHNSNMSQTPLQAVGTFDSRGASITKTMADADTRLGDPGKPIRSETSSEMKNQLYEKP